MQNLRRCFFRNPGIILTTLYASSLLFLSSCSGTGSDSESDQIDPLTGAANTTNLTPLIADTSYNCDPILESASFKVGETNHFTLSVSDESPLTLTYSVDSSNMDSVRVTVDENGIFTITALQPGESYLWLVAEDEVGLVDEYELKVVVN